MAEINFQRLLATVLGYYDRKYKWNMFSAFSNGILIFKNSFREVSISGITDTEEERIKESAAYVAKRNLFATGEGVSVSKVAKSTSEEEHHEKKSRKVAIRESAERVALKKTVKE